MEFEDMAKVYDVDPRLTAHRRTRRWLLSKRERDGAGRPATGCTRRPTRCAASPGDMAKLGHHGLRRLGGLRQPADRIRRHRRGTRTCSPSDRSRSSDPYVLALTCNALLALDPKGSSAPRTWPASMRSSTMPDGKHVVGQQATGGAHHLLRSRRSGTSRRRRWRCWPWSALESRRLPATTRAPWPGSPSRRTANGTWHSTQATVLALKALLAGTGRHWAARRSAYRGALGERQKHTIVIPADQADVMQQLDLSAELTAGDNALVLDETSGTGSGYQVAFRYHVAGEAPSPRTKPLSIRIDYDKTELAGRRRGDRHGHGDRPARRRRW